MTKDKYTAIRNTVNFGAVISSAASLTSVAKTGPEYGKTKHVER